MKKKYEINKQSGAPELNSKLFSIINKILNLWHNQCNKFAILSLRCKIFNSNTRVLNLQLFLNFAVDLLPYSFKKLRQMMMLWNQEIN
jgi:hypothetical protein